MKLEEAKEGLKRFCEYEDSIVLTDNALYEIQELIETVLQALDNSISKDKVKEKIERAKKVLETLDNEYERDNQIIIINYLEELLEDK